MKYCTQCGIEGRPMVSVGVDSDGEPACAGHSDRGSVTLTATAVREFCFCGRDKGHRGRHKGVPFSAPGVRKELPLPNKAEVIHSEPDEMTPDGKLFVADSVTVVDLNSGGRIALMWKGDMLKLMANEEDRHFLLALMNVIRCRGKMMQPYSNKMKDKRTGKMIPIQVDEGFIDDMYSMFEPEDKARMLAAAWEKGEGQ